MKLAHSVVLPRKKYATLYLTTYVKKLLTMYMVTGLINLMKKLILLILVLSLVGCYESNNSLAKTRFNAIFYSCPEEKLSSEYNTSGKQQTLTIKCYANE